MPVMNIERLQIEVRKQSFSEGDMLEERGV